MATSDYEHLRGELFSGYEHITSKAAARQWALEFVDRFVRPILFIAVFVRVFDLFRRRGWLGMRPSRLTSKSPKTRSSLVF